MKIDIAGAGAVGMACMYAMTLRGSARRGTTLSSPAARCYWQRNRWSG